MVLEGVVTNVAAFGAFVDVGVHQDGLVHVSAMSHTFVKDPRDVVKSGDVVKVRVLDVDVPRKRISLTLRLDDEAPAGGGRPAGGDGRGGTGGGRAARPPAAARVGGGDGARGGQGGGQRGGSGGGQSGGGQRGRGSRRRRATRWRTGRRVARWPAAAARARWRRPGQRRHGGGAAPRRHWPDTSRCRAEVTNALSPAAPAGEPRRAGPCRGHAARQDDGRGDGPRRRHGPPLINTISPRWWHQRLRDTTTSANWS